MITKGIILDLDGVIVFTDRFHYLAWKAVADKEGIYFDEVINNRLRGVSRMESLEIILERAHKTYRYEEKIALAEYKNALYRKYLADMSEKDVASDIRKFLVAMRTKGYKLAIASSSKNAQFIVDKVNLRNLFDVIVDGNDITHSKPHPEVFLAAAERLGLKPADCVVVEDAEAGIDAANIGGFLSAGIGQAAKYAKTDIRLHALTDLATYLKFA